MKLITETIEDIDLIVEGNSKGGKDYKIKGVFMQADIKNRNGRVYPKEIMEKEVNGHLYIANDNLKRIADALDTIIKMVKEDQERSRKYMEEKKDE